MPRRMKTSDHAPTSVRDSSTMTTLDLVAQSNLVGARTTTEPSVPTHTPSLHGAARPRRVMCVRGTRPLIWLRISRDGTAVRRLLSGHKRNVLSEAMAGHSRECVQLRLG